MSARDSIDVLLFDLGGVLVRIDFGRVFAHWAAAASADAKVLAARFRFDSAYEQHERGELSGAAYLAHVARELAIDITPDALESGWNAIFEGTFDAAFAAIAQVPLRKAVFSNTNEIHRPVWTQRYAAQLAPFERLFSSSQMGLRKPEQAAFARIAQQLGVAPERILFFDDLEENVVGAREAGLNAVHVQDADVVPRTLAALR